MVLGSNLRLSLLCLGFLVLHQRSEAEAGLYLNLIPIFGVVSVFIFLGERLTPIQWIGALLILLAVFAISHLQKNKAVLQRDIGQKESLVEVKA
jgi:threonine/homoserine efflux transporter RhtA